MQFTVTIYLYYSLRY